MDFDGAAEFEGADYDDRRTLAGRAISTQPTIYWQVRGFVRWATTRFVSLTSSKTCTASSRYILSRANAPGRYLGIVLLSAAVDIFGVNTTSDKLICTHHIYKVVIDSM